MNSAKLTFLVLILSACVCAAQNRPADANLTRTEPTSPAAPASPQIVLGEPNITGTMTVEEAIMQQKKITDFSEQQISNQHLSQFVWTAQSAIDAITRQPPPENDAVSITLYFCFPTGVYRSNTAASALDLLASADVRASLAAAAHNLTSLKNAPCIIVMAGSINTAATVTRDQSRNLMMIAAGKIAQSLQFEAQSLGLGTLGIGAFDLGKVKRLARLQPQQEPAYIMAIGYPAGTTPQQAARVQQKHALIILPGTSLPDELFNLRDALTAARIKTFVAQSGTSRIRIDRGERIIQVDMQLQDVVVNDYDAIIIISSIGNPSFPKEPLLLNIIRTAVQNGRIVAAGGETTAALANAGVLNGVRITGDQRVLLKSGGIYTGNLVEMDQGIVTTLSEQQESLMARAVISALQQGRSVTPPAAPQTGTQPAMPAPAPGAY